jgi:hypothetical protein
MMCFQDPPRVESLNHTWIPHVNNLRSKLMDGKVSESCLIRRVLGFNPQASSRSSASISFRGPEGRQWRDVEYEAGDAP